MTTCNDAIRNARTAIVDGLRDADPAARHARYISRALHRAYRVARTRSDTCARLNWTVDAIGGTLVDLQLEFGQAIRELEALEKCLKALARY